MVEAQAIRLNVQQGSSYLISFDIDSAGLLPAALANRLGAAWGKAWSLSCSSAEAVCCGDTFGYGWSSWRCSSSEILQQLCYKVLGVQCICWWMGRDTRNAGWAPLLSWGTSRLPCCQDHPPSVWLWTLPLRTCVSINSLQTYKWSLKSPDWNSWYVSLLTCIEFHCSWAWSRYRGSCSTINETAESYSRWSYLDPKWKMFVGKNLSFVCLQGRCTCVGCLGHQSLSNSMNLPEKQVGDFNFKSIVTFMTPRRKPNLSFNWYT